MHELSLAEGLVELIEEQARAERFARVRAVFLEVGALANVEPRALALGFEAASRGTVADGARLEIARPEGVGWCVECEARVPLAARGEACPRCGGYGLLLVDGGELRVTELEVE